MKRLPFRSKLFFLSLCIANLSVVPLQAAPSKPLKTVLTFFGVFTICISGQQVPHIKGSSIMESLNNHGISDTACVLPNKLVCKVESTRQVVMTTFDQINDALGGQMGTINLTDFTTSPTPVIIMMPTPAPTLRPTIRPIKASRGIKAFRELPIAQQSIIIIGTVTGVCLIMVTTCLGYLIYIGKKS